jgi:hypothetical protein
VKKCSYPQVSAPAIKNPGVIMGTIAERIDKKFTKIKNWEKANPGLSWSSSENEVAEPKIYIPKEMLRSPAYRGLSRVGLLLLQDFFAKRIMKQASKKKWFIENNGNIIFPFQEAVEKGYSRNQFRNGIDELQRTGFLDITHLGKGGRKPLKGHADCSTYLLDDRWKQYGTPEFKPARKPRRKDSRQGRGWALVMNDPKMKKKILAKRKKKL